MPSRQPSPVAILCAWPQSCEARRGSPRAWSADRVLSRFATPAVAALAVRDHALADTVLAALASRTADPVATLAMLAGLAPRLSSITARWRRAGMPAEDLADAEADLLAETLDTLRRLPTLRADLVVRTAWHRTHARRRTDRARAARTGPLNEAAAATAELATNPLTAIVTCLAAALCTATLRRDEAAAIWADVCGWSPSEAAQLTGWSPQTWRARRLRAFDAARRSPAFDAMGVA